MDAFGKIALQVGAVTPDDLRRALRLQEERGGGDLESILLAIGALSLEMADAVHELAISSQTLCPRCGRPHDSLHCSCRMKRVA